MSTLQGLTGRTYDLGQVQFLLGGVPIVGYGEEGGFNLAPTQDGFVVTEGADGKPVFSKVNSDLVIVEITVLQGSTGDVSLAAAEALQRKSLIVIPIPAAILDISTGLSGGTGTAIMMNWPERALGRTIGEAAWRVALPGFLAASVILP